MFYGSLYTTSESWNTTLGLEMPVNQRVWKCLLIKWSTTAINVFSPYFSNMSSSWLGNSMIMKSLICFLTCQIVSVKTKWEKGCFKAVDVLSRQTERKSSSSFVKTFGCHQSKTEQIQWSQVRRIYYMLTIPWSS